MLRFIREFFNFSQSLYAFEHYLENRILDHAKMYYSCNIFYRKIWIIHVKTRALFTRFHDVRQRLFYSSDESNVLRSWTTIWQFEEKKLITLKTTDKRIQKERLTVVMHLLIFHLSFVNEHITHTRRTQTC